MAYTIIEVAQKTGISPHTLRFWAKKGVLPFVERDKNGVKYFSNSDIEWVRWINWFRKTNMSVEDIRKYVNLALRGDGTARERMAMLERQQRALLAEIEELKEVASKLDYKLDYYAKMIENGQDAMNPNSKEYVKCDKACEETNKAVKKVLKLSNRRNINYENNINISGVK
ncbi:MerR family transcriptional regulator [Helicobacter saguini]|uniref:MerR family transcriptional regulator n=1 Tax=Helicobacter saguini TaxID=1548018 RepID=A0A347W4E0_9HELI|nr:MerR family transcriptional regulator [Helicobacter saguini]MWV61883.1 MerR family transcriptional regulator [Helicobacter saguini]MWV67442.1 MerR family transcriptional regulator [Helicobacter saguini]MWV69795.1 MerR family transcriptional regulator [Helicobacter saguini]MWV72988.1 MerR family transcriptional regulator [Helicobacter saguini]TLD95632.1 MerR family transcriptional regulator [Helicobacter saguini]